MPILPSDIKLLESERMRDTSDGGGRMTGRVIASGEAGNIFPKVSRVDAVNGRVNLRKIYLAVRTATLDMYAGAHIIITEPPENDRISVCLFSTASAFDQRSAARDRIESYVVAGPLSRMRLYGDQLIGQKAITVYQMESEPLPEVGQVFVLSVESGGVSSAQQYVRVTDVDHELRTFTDSAGEFRRRVITLSIGSKLGQTFRSNDITRYSSTVDATRVRLTQVADASEYFGIQPLGQAGEIGTKALQLASVYAALVPMALVLSLPHDFENRQLLVALTLGIVLFTLLIQGTTVKLLIRKLGLDRPDAFTLGVTTVARLAAAEKGLARLEALETAEKFPDRIINELRQTYDAKIKDRRAALENLRNTPEFESGTIRKNLWIESLSVMRSGYNQLDDRGLLSAYTYRDLLSISDQHIDIVLAAGYLPESSRWSDAGLICVKRNIIQRIVDLLHWKNLTRRVKLGRMAHELEKYFSIYYGSHRVLTMLESSKAIYGDYQELYEDCKKYFQALNKMSSERMDIMKKRDTEEMQIATRNILQRVIYDAELSELEAMKDNGFITEALADCMISEIEEKIDLTKHKAV